MNRQETEAYIRSTTIEFQDREWRVEYWMGKL